MHSSYKITLLRADCLPKHLQGDLILAVGLLDHLHQQRLQRVNLRLRECARPSVALLVGALEHVPRDSWRRECGTQPGCFVSMGVPMSRDVWAEGMRGSPKQLVCMLQLFDRVKSYIRFPRPGFCLLWGVLTAVLTCLQNLPCDSSPVIRISSLLIS